MTHTLRGKKVAILVADGFEQIELTEPRKALEQAGEAHVVSPAKGKVKGWNHTEWGGEIPSSTRGSRWPRSAMGRGQ